MQDFAHAGLICLQALRFSAVCRSNVKAAGTLAIPRAGEDSSTGTTSSS